MVPLPKRPRDPNQLAKLIVDIATGEAEPERPKTAPAKKTTGERAPAMAAGVTDRLWEIGDIVKLVEDAEAAPRKRGPYKKAARLKVR